MFGLLVLLFIVVPIAEIYVLVQVSSGIGVLPAIGLMLAISVFGAWLVRREGFAVFTRVRDRLFSGQVPTSEIIDGGLIMFGGALLLTPGFLTDAVGFLCLLPPSRAVMRGIISRRSQRRTEAMKAQVRSQFGVGFGPGFGTPSSGGSPMGGQRSARPQDSRIQKDSRFREDVVDVEEVEIVRTDRPFDQPQIEGR